MTVLQRITKDISTAYTDVPLILGTDLANLATMVKTEMDKLDLSLTDGRSIDWDMHEDWYGPIWYHKMWELVVRPTINQYLEYTKPSAWFRKFYQTEAHE